ncbi:hypothetical protein GCM10027176_20760 [Actinoallomurus bryophytorum]
MVEADEESAVVDGPAAGFVPLKVVHRGIHRAHPTRRETKTGPPPPTQATTPAALAGEGVTSFSKTSVEPPPDTSAVLGPSVSRVRLAACADGAAAARRARAVDGTWKLATSRP